MDDDRMELAWLAWRANGSYSFDDSHGVRQVKLVGGGMSQIEGGGRGGIQNEMKMMFWHATFHSKWTLLIIFMGRTILFYRSGRVYCFYVHICMCMYIKSGGGAYMTHLLYILFNIAVTPALFQHSLIYVGKFISNSQCSYRSIVLFIVYIMTYNMSSIHIIVFVKMRNSIR